MNNPQHHPSITQTHAIPALATQTHWRPFLCGALFIVGLLFAATTADATNTSNTKATIDANSQGPMILLEDFRNTPQDRWEFIADTVMGGVSTGRVQFVSLQSPDDPAQMDTVLQLSGTVSTANNGGFIQARLPLAQTSNNPLPDSAKGIWLKTRGNEQKYFVHVRTSGTILPWQYYQASFEVTRDWQVIELPWDSFKRSDGISGSLLRDVPLADKIKSIAIVAFGRDHEADVEVAQIGYY